MKNPKNKTVFIAFDNFYSNIFGVFRSKQALNKQLKVWQQDIYDFAKSEDLKVTIYRGMNSYGEHTITISDNTPYYGLIVTKNVIENSKSISTGDICTVWISKFLYEPGDCALHLSQEEALAYLDSIGLLDEIKNPNDRASLKEYQLQ